MHLRRAYHLATTIKLEQGPPSAPLIVLLVAGLTLAALVFTAQPFAMTADTSQLISKRLE
jgi:hypothetical protein